MQFSLLPLITLLVPTTLAALQQCSSSVHPQQKATTHFRFFAGNNQWVWASQSGTSVTINERCEMRNGKTIDLGIVCAAHSGNKDECWFVPRGGEACQLDPGVCTNIKVVYGW